MARSVSRNDAAVTPTAVMAAGDEEPRRSRRALVALASGLCLLGAACAVAVAEGGAGDEEQKSELFGPWNPTTAHVASPQLSMRASKSMYSMWQQAKWARLFANKTPQPSAELNERSVADAIGFQTALAAASPAGPVRYPSELASTRASDLQHNAPHYLQQLELAAEDTPAHMQSLAAAPKQAAKARTQSLDYMESKPRSNYRHPGDMDVYQTYEYYPRPEGQGVTDYDGNRLWTEMQRDYRAQHPSATTYPAVPVVFKEDSGGGHPIANPLSQPVEDIYQGMGAEDNMWSPYGMGTMPEGGAKEHQTSGGTMLSPREGFKIMKKEAEDKQAPARASRGDASGYSYRHQDWKENYEPRANADHKTFLATPSVATPEYYSDSAPQKQNMREQRQGGRGGEEVDRERRELEQERRDLRDKQELIIQEQQKLEKELQEEKDKKQAAKPSMRPTPAQQLYRWERAHGVDDASAYDNFAGGSHEVGKARHQARAKKAAAEDRLRAKQQMELQAQEQQMMSVQVHKPESLDVQDRYERDEDILNLKETIRSMAHRQAELTTKTDGLKDQVHALVEMEKAALNTFNGRLHGNAKIEASLRAQEAKERKAAEHDEKLQQQIDLLKKEEKDKVEEQEAYSAKQSARTQTLKLLQNKIAGTAKVQSDKVAKQAMLAENERLNAQMRLTMKADGAGGGGEAAPVATAAKKAVVTSAAFAPAAVAKPINIPKFVLEKADSMVKHKVTRELAKKFESQIDSDTNFIFSGSREDETNDENSQNLYNLDNAEESAPKKQLAQGEAAVTAPEHGFTNLHQMEKQVLSQLIEANQQRAQEAAQVAAQKAAAAKAAAKQKLALKKLRYQQEVKKEAQEAAQKAADKKAEKEKAAAATAAAAAKYAKAHKPVTKMTVRERALAFVRAFDDSVAEKEGTTLKSSHDGTNLGATLGGDSSSSLSDHSSTSIVLSAPMVSLSAPGTTGL